MLYSNSAELPDGAAKAWPELLAKEAAVAIVAAMKLLRVVIQFLPSMAILLSISVD
jgi:hypothetical protein